MDWNKLKNQALWLKDKALEYKDIAVQKSQEFWEKAVDFTSNTVSKTPIAIKVIADFDKVKSDKILVIFWIKKDDDESKKLLLQMPIIATKAWTKTITVRTCDVEEAKELAAHLEIKNVPVVLAYKESSLIKRIDSKEEIKIFLKDFNF